MSGWIVIHSKDSKASIHKNGTGELVKSFKKNQGKRVEQNFKFYFRVWGGL